MGNIRTSVAELVGATPLLELVKLERELGLAARLLAKLEAFNPAGSVKDRVALALIEDGERRGLLRPGGTIIEPTSGNTGIGLACIGTARGYRTVIVMPDSMSVERIRLMEGYGARVVLTPGAQGMAGAIRKAEELHRALPGSYIPGQFINPANPQAHYCSTGPEIWADTDGELDIFVAGVGTGGTLTGIGRYLREQKPGVGIVAVEPAGSPVLSGGTAGPHGIQGIGGGFVPDVLDTELYDEVIAVTDGDAYAMGRLLARTEGVLAGISSGAALWAAVQVARREENRGKTVVVLLPDTGDHYLSTPLFE